ncbi:MAG: TldD/PmbA family protein [Bacilli bacterium]
MTKEQYENILNSITETGCDFAEVYYEKSKTKNYELVASEINKISVRHRHGIGIRSALNTSTRYTASSDISKDNLDRMIKEHLNTYNSKRIIPKLELKEEKVSDIVPCTIKHDDYETEKKIALLHKINEIARNYSKLVTQVKATLIEEDKEITIASTRGFMKSTSYTNTRLLIHVFVEENDLKETLFTARGSAQGYEFLDDIDVEKLTKDTVDKAINNLHAETIKGGEYPVIIKNGFGAVIFHEACGHGLEATSIAPKTSCFTGLLNQKIASDKVTLIDDATISNAWGSFNIDDEGTEPQKKVLIENGVLKSYMVDYLNQRKMDNCSITGSGRRQDYTFEPTSRMSNTYIAPGKDSVEDMIESTKYGIYCEKLGGGLVDTASGNFNFDVQCARLIENGKLTKYLKGLCLRGTGKDVLTKIESVSNDLILADGYCGSVSGKVFVTCGQPTIKVSKMQVGGSDE